MSGRKQRRRSLYDEANRALGAPERAPQPQDARRDEPIPSIAAVPPGRASMGYRVLAFVLLILALWLAAIFPVVWIGGVLLDAVRGGPLEEIVSTSIFVVWLMAPIVIAGRIAREIPRAQEGMPRPLFYRVLDALGALARIRHGL